MRAKARCGLFLAGVALTLGCSDSFAPPSEVTTLRVLALQADRPFVAPGDTAQLSLLFYDGKAKREATPRHIRIAWFSACANPPGDLYYKCYPALHALADAVTDSDLRNEAVPTTAQGQLGYGATFRAAIPSDALTVHPQPVGIVHPYALSYVFLAACAGELRRVSVDSEQFPFGCYSELDGRRLSDDDFVVGYFPLYVYEDLQNQNPTFANLSFAAGSPGASCATESDCSSDQTCDDGGHCVPVVPVCAAKHRGDCPVYAFAPTVDPSSIELALSAQVRDDQATTELIWVAYYASDGDYEADAKIVSDPDVGRAAAYPGMWRAPAAPGLAHLWAVVRDSRGGSSWLALDVLVR